MAKTTARDARSRTRPRWPYLGRSQIMLLVASLVTIIGSFLPWLDTGFGSVNGLQLGGLITFYAAAFAVPGAIWRNRWIVVGHAVLLAAVALGVGGWQLFRALRELPGLGQAWLPAPGLVLVLLSGLVAAVATAELVTGRAPRAERSG